MTPIRHLSIMDDSDLVDSGDGGGDGGGALPVVAVDVACRGERSTRSLGGKGALLLLPIVRHLGVLFLER